MSYLLDTHVLLWWFEADGRLTALERAAIEGASAEAPLLLADISLWEVAMLHAKGRIQLTRPLEQWLDLTTAPPLVRRLPLTPRIAADAATLDLHGDPADRMIVATARVHGATLLTHDARILSSGLCSTLS